MRGALIAAISEAIAQTPGRDKMNLRDTVKKIAPFCSDEVFDGDVGLMAEAALDGALSILENPSDEMRAAVTPAYQVVSGWGGHTEFLPTLGGDGMSQFRRIINTLKAPA